MTKPPTDTHLSDPLLDVADQTSFTHGEAAPGARQQLKAAAHKVEELLHHKESHGEPFSWSHQLES